MNKTLAFIAAGIAGTTVLFAAPASARDDISWSVTVGSPGIGAQVYSAPPPRVIYAPQPVYVERAAQVRYVPPYGHAHGRTYGRSHGQAYGYDDRGRGREHDRHEGRHHHRYEY